MSLDRRLREDLDRSSQAIDEREIDVVLGAIVRVARRRLLIRRITAVALAFALGLSAVILPRVLGEVIGLSRPQPAVPGSVPGIIGTFAGTGTDGSFGDGGPAAEAGLSYPVDVAVDGMGNVFILDHAGQRIRKVDPSGTITTVVGPPAGGRAPVAAAGEAGSIELSDATGIDVDSDGNLYVSPGKTTVVKIDPSGNITTVAGTGAAGYSGDGGPAIEADLQRIWDVAVDLRGNLFIAAGPTVRKVDAHGIITTVVGDGTRVFDLDTGRTLRADIGHISGLSIDYSGNVYFIDIKNNRIGKIAATGPIKMLAGPGARPTCVGQGGGPFTDEGVPADELDLCGAEHLSLDQAGNIFVADTYNHRIVMIASDGIVTTVAGTGVDAFSGDGGSPLSAELSEPSGVTVGPDGVLYIADSGNSRVRSMTLHIADL